MTEPTAGDGGPPRAGPGFPHREVWRAQDVSPGGDETEFDDEPPGAYLEEGRLGRGAVAWGCFLAIAIACVAGFGWVWQDELAQPAGDRLEDVPPAAPAAPAAPGPEAPESPRFDPAAFRFPLRVAWTVLPVLAAFGFLITLFIRVNQGLREAREARLGSLAVKLQLAALLLWLAARFLLGIDFAGGS